MKLSICLSRFSLWDFINFLKINYFLLLEIHPVMLLYIFLDDDKIYSFTSKLYNELDLKSFISVFEPLNS